MSKIDVPESAIANKLEMSSVAADMLRTCTNAPVLYVLINHVYDDWLEKGYPQQKKLALDVLKTVY